MNETVDEKIVSLKFDNKEFIAKIGESITAFSELKDNLNTKGILGNFSGIGNALKSISFSPVLTGVSDVCEKFNVMDTVAKTVTYNMTNSVLAMSKNLATAFTTEPIMSGFKEYETQMGAIQTVLANTSDKGTTLEGVNGALDELNTYADKTIYNFTEMTKNIGTFTAAGVDLDTSVNAIKGIANLAAVSGSNSQQASTAMYQLSQALAAGTVKLQDWNSVVNAGMGGEVFQNALKETARVHGIAVDDMIKKDGSFRESLKEGWLTTEVLTETLSKFTGDLTDAQLKEMGYTDDQIKKIQKMAKTANDAATKVKTFTQLLDTLKEAAGSGWTKTWQLIIGDFEQAKDFWTQISDSIGGLINKSSDQRNFFVGAVFGKDNQATTDLWSKTIGKAGKDTETFQKILKKTAEAHGIDVDSMIKKNGSFEKSLNEGWLSKDIFDEALEGFKNFSDAELKAQGYTDDEIESFKNLAEAADDATSPINALRDALNRKNENNISGRDHMINTIMNLGKVIGQVSGAVVGAFTDIFPPATINQARDFLKSLDDLSKSLILSDENAEKLRKTFSGIFSVFSFRVQIFEAIGSGIKQLLSPMKDLGQSFLDSSSSFGSFMTNVSRNFARFDVFGKIVSGLVTAFQNAWKNVMPPVNFTSIFGKIETVIAKLQSQFMKLAQKFQSSKFQDILTRISKGILSIGKIIAQILAPVLNGIPDIFSRIVSVGDRLASAFAWIGDVIAKTSDLTEKTNLFQKAWDKLLEIADAIGTAFSTAWDAVFPASETFDSVTSVISTVVEKISSFIDNIKITDETTSKLTRIFQGLFSILSLIGKTIGAVVTCIANLLEPVFDTLGGTLLDVAASIGDFFTQLNDGATKTGFFGRMVQGIVEFVTNLVEAITEFIKVIKPAVQIVWNFASAIAIVLGNALGGIAEKLNNFFSAFQENIATPGLDTVAGVLEKIHKRTSKLSGAAQKMCDAMGKAFDKLGKKLNGSTVVKFAIKAGQFFGKIGSAIGRFATKVGGMFAGMFKNFKISDIQKITDFVNTVLFSGGIGGIIANIKNSVKNVTDSAQGIVDSIKGLAKGIKEGVVGVLEGLKDTLAEYQKELKAKALKEIAIAIAVLAGSLFVLAMIDADKLWPAVGALGALFGELVGAMTAYNKLNTSIGPTKFSDTFANNSTFSNMIKMAAAILVLAIALKKIADLKPEELVKGLVGIGILMAELVATSIIMTKFGAKGTKGALGMVIFAAAIYVLTKAVRQLADLDWEELVKGLVGVGVLLAEVSLFLNTAKMSLKSTATATGILILSAAILVLGKSVENFGNMSWNQIIKGLTTVGILLAELAIFTNLTGNAKKVIATAVSMVILAAAINKFYESVSAFAGMSWDSIAKGLISIGILLGELTAFSLFAGEAKHILVTSVAMAVLAKAMEKLQGTISVYAGMSWEQIVKGLVGLAGALAAVTIAVNLMPKNLILTATGLVIVGVALKSVMKVMQGLGGMSWSGIAKGLIALGGSLAILAIGMHVIQGAWKGALALTAVSLALALLVPELLLLSKISVGGILKMMGALAGFFAVIGVATMLLTPAIPAMFGLAAAIGVLSIAMAACGVAMGLLGAGMTAFAVGIGALGGALATVTVSIGKGIADILVSIAEALPKIAEGIGKAIITFLQTLAGSIDEIGNVIEAFVLKACEVIVKCVPEIVDTVFTVIIQVLKTLNEKAPEILDQVITFLINIMNALAGRMPELVDAAVNLFASFFTAVKDALIEMSGGDFTDVLTNIGLFAAILVAASLLKGLIPGAMLGILGMFACVAEIGALFAALGGLAQIPGVEWLISEGSNFANLIGSAIGEFIGSIIGGVAEGAASHLPEIGTALSDFSTNAAPFFAVVKDIGTDCLQPVKDLAASILAITGADLLSGIASFITGESSIEKFATDLPVLATGLANYAAIIDSGTFNEDKITASTNLATMLASLASNDIPKEGGVVGFIMGESDLGDFGTQLPLLAMGLASYAAIIDSATFNEDKITASANLASMLASLASDEIPSTGGVWQWLKGEDDLSKFGTQLPQLATGLASYANTINDATFTKDKITASTNLASMLASLASDQIPTSGGVLEWITGKKDLSKFGEQLPKLAEGLNGYATALSDDISSDKVTAAGNAATMLATVGQMLNDQNLGGFFDSGDLTNFGKQISEFGGYLSTYYSNISGIDGGKMTSLTTSIKSVFESMKTISTVDEDKINSIQKSMDGLGSLNFDSLKTAASGLSENISSGFAGSGKAITSNASDMMTSALTAVSGFRSRFKTAGTGISAALAEALGSKQSAIKIAFNTGLSGAVSNVRAYYSSFESSGKYDANGLISGLNSKYQEVYNAGYRLGLAAKKGKNDATDTHSPSREFIKSGIFDAQGLIKGADSYKDKVYKAYFGMGENSLDGLRTALSEASGEFQNGIDDTAPTIRPVIDLSNVQNGLATMNGMMRNSSAFDITPNMSAIQANFGTSRDATNQDVVNAVSSLDRTLSKLRVNNTTINGITYDDGSNINSAVQQLIHAAQIERRA